MRFLSRTATATWPVSAYSSQNSGASCAGALTQEVLLSGEYTLGRGNKCVEDCQCYTTCLQIGDNEEVMYLAAKSNEKRTAWMQAFRKGIIITPGVSGM